MQVREYRDARREYDRLNLVVASMRLNLADKID